jgi:hypothetical protein
MKLMTGWIGKDFRKARFGNQNARSKTEEALRKRAEVELLKPDPVVEHYPKEANLWKRVFKIPEPEGKK